MSQDHSYPGAHQNANVAMFLMRTWATSIQVFIRGNFGERYLGLQALAVFFFAPMYCAVKRMPNFGEAGFWLSLYLVLLCMHNAVIRMRKRRGQVWHSYYDGLPGLMRFFLWMKCSEITFKQWIEPLIVMGTGLLLSENNEPLGTYLLFGGACMFCLAHLGAAQENAWRTDLNDSILDQQQLAEHFRNPRGGRS